MLAFEKFVNTILLEFSIKELNSPVTRRIRGTDNPYEVKRNRLTDYIMHVTGGTGIFTFEARRITDKEDDAGNIIEPAGTKVVYKARLKIPLRYVKGTGTEKQTVINRFKTHNIITFLALEKNGKPYVGKDRIRSANVNEILWISTEKVKSKVVD